MLVVWLDIGFLCFIICFFGEMRNAEDYTYLFVGNVRCVLEKGMALGNLVEMQTEREEVCLWLSLCL